MLGMPFTVRRNLSPTLSNRPGMYLPFQIMHCVLLFME